jgi:NADH dehydrogenase
VVTLTNSFCRPNPFGRSIGVYPLDFSRPDRLESVLSGASVLYNTYYVRFNHRGSVSFSYEQAVKNSAILFRAARNAGVKRVVHISITNPSLDSDLEYFRRKAEIERLLIESGLSYSILRPAVLFGDDGILMNNIAWLLRRFPVFGVFGDGGYRLQPIHADDLAKLAVEKGREPANGIVDAVGPETFTYRELVEAIGQGIGKPRPILSIPPSIGFAVSYVLGRVLHDLPVTRDEIKGLMANLLYVDSPPTGKTRLTDWVRDNAHWLGTRYFSEIERRSEDCDTRSRMLRVPEMR